MGYGGEASLAAAITRTFTSPSLSRIMASYTSTVTSSSSSTALWDSLRTDAWRIDGDLENRLPVLEGLAHATTDAESYEKFQTAANEAASVLNRMKHIVSQLHDAATQQRLGGGSSATAAVNTAHAQRFESSLGEKQLCLNRLTSESKKRHERFALAAKVQTEINIYRESSEMRHLAGEHDSLTHTQRQTRAILEQAEISRQKLSSQRARFMAMADGLTNIAEQIPIVKDVLKRIDSKRRRDVVILAVVIALCLFMIFLFW